MLSVRRLRQAASVSVASPDRDRRVLMAAEALIGTGMMAAARTVANDVKACAESPYRSFVLGCIAFAEGRVADGETLVATTAAASPDGPGDLAARAAAGAGIVRMLMGRWDEAITVCDAAIVGDADWASGLSRTLLAVRNVRLGRFDELLDQVRTRVEAEMAPCHSSLPRGAGGARRDQALQRRSHRRGRRSRRGGRPRPRRRANTSARRRAGRPRGGELPLGHWEDAIVASELGASLAQDTEQIVGLQQAHAAAAVVHARCGRFDLSQAHVDTLGTIESLLPWRVDPPSSAPAAPCSPRARASHHDAMYQAMASLVDHPTNQPGERLGQWNWLVVGVDALIGVGRLEVARPPGPPASQRSSRNATC